MDEAKEDGLTVSKVFTKKNPITKQVERVALAVEFRVNMTAWQI